MSPRLHPAVFLVATACSGRDDTAGDTAGGFELVAGTYLYSNVQVLDDGCNVAKHTHPESLDGTTTAITEVTETTVVFNGDGPGEMKYTREGNTFTWERVDDIDRTMEGIDCVMTVVGRFEDELVADNDIEWLNTISAEGTGTACDMPIPCETRIRGWLTLQVE